MKILSVLLLLALLLGAAVWKLENPNGGMATVGSQMSALGERLTRGAESVMADAEPATASETDTADSTRQLLRQLETRAATDGAQSARLERTLDELSSRLDATETRLAGAQRDQRATTDAVADIMVELETDRAPSRTTAREALAAQLDAHALQLDTQASVIEELSRRLAAMDGADAASGARVGGLETGLDELRAGLGVLGERIGTLENELLAIAAPTGTPVASDDDQAARQAAITALRDDIDRQFDEVESRVEALSQANEPVDGTVAVASLTGALDDTRDRIADLEDRLDSTASEDSVQAETLEQALNARIDALEAQLQARGGDSGPVQGQIASLRAETDDLAGERDAGRTFAAIQESLEVAELKVFFDFNSTDITADTASELDAFIEQQQDADAALSIFGLTDRTGPADYNRQLADRRARNVRAYLIENGLDDSRIRAATGLGEEAVAGLLADEQGDAGQRAVVIYTTRR